MNEYALPFPTEHPQPFPIEEVVAELNAAQAQGRRLAGYRCDTCNAHFISMRDAWNHNTPIFGPGYHLMLEVR